MSEPDVLVIGGGLGGTVAALSAVETDATATVRLVVPRERPLATHSGLIDVVGYPGPNEDPVARPMAAARDLPDGHPIVHVGIDALDHGLTLFDEATAGSYAGGHSVSNALVPTGLGEYRPAARYPQAVEPGLLSRPESMTLVEFDQFPDFDAFHAVERLQSIGVPFQLDAIQVSLGVAPGSEPPALHLAQALDENTSLDRGIPIRESVVRSVRAQLAETDRIGFPAVLGLDQAAAVRADIGGDLAGNVFEIPLGSPSVAGLRLQSELFKAVTDAGVKIERGVDVQGFARAGGHIDRVELDGSGESFTVSPGAVVLATGGAAGGGITADRSGVHEPRFGCHVPHPDDTLDWTATTSLGDHRLATFGVRIDANSRPQTADGAPIFENLFAAGRVIGGHNAVAEHAVGGVALATGAASGRTAISGQT